MLDFFDPRATEFQLGHIVTAILRERNGIRPHPLTVTPPYQPLVQLNRYRRARARSPLSPAPRARPGKTGGYFTPQGIIFAGQPDATPPR